MTELEDERLVTVATDLDVMGAAILQSRLEAEGIESYLIDGITSDIAWHLSDAVGGAKVQVKSSDAQLAIRIAETKPDVEDSEDIEWPVPSPRRSYLDKAFRAGLLGMLFFPLQIYSLGLLVRALTLKGEGSMAPKFVLVLFINSPTIALVLMSLLYYVSFGTIEQALSINPIDYRTIPHY